MPPILLCQCKGDRMKNKLYVAYGSNLNLPQMLVRCPTAKVVGASEIKDYALVFRGGRYGAVATIEPKEGASETGQSPPAETSADTNFCVSPWI